MGIRYYGYAVDADRTADALADPRAFISSDPLADAWGLERRALVSVTTFEQVTPERDLLYLDKAWRDLQWLTAGTPAYLLFEGDVTMTPFGWIPWVRALAPYEIAPIADDLQCISEATVVERFRDVGFGIGDADYLVHFLDRARAFTAGLAREGRGIAYLIG